ncbi:hypothetical protein D4764_16G0009410 [Takifugu flavidus]|uniref:Uncharacterized protein n=1 Tax=Takifugu flavidus TaxID=433684 RepID=A0A5C6NY49_9TELE|nr:hypothetical protein D4764_16G0009410 [Takifugu flavidus]
MGTRSCSGDHMPLTDGERRSGSWLPHLKQSRVRVHGVRFSRALPCQPTNQVTEPQVQRYESEPERAFTVIVEAWDRDNGTHSNGCRPLCFDLSSCCAPADTLSPNWGPAWTVDTSKSVPP